MKWIDNFKITKKNNVLITKDDVGDMIRMKRQGMTFEAIGEIFGLSKKAAYRRIKRFMDKEVIAV